MLFYPLYYNIISLASLKITLAFHLLLGFVDNQMVYWDFKIQNSVRITEGSDNGDSGNRGPTVLQKLFIRDAMMHILGVSIYHLLYHDSVILADFW